MYKASKDQVNVFGLQTQYGGGKTTGFALVYDSPEALKKFEPHYRLVRVGVASKIEKPSRQQRTSRITSVDHGNCIDANMVAHRQATKEPPKDSPGYSEGQGPCQEEGEIDDSLFLVRVADGGKWCCGNGFFVFVRMHSQWLFIWCIRCQGIDIGPSGRDVSMDPENNKNNKPAFRPRLS
jgi:Ribosomal protein S24e